MVAAVAARLRRDDRQLPRVDRHAGVQSGADLARAIESVLGQTLPDLELIISDNASTDETEADLPAIRRGRPAHPLHAAPRTDRRLPQLSLRARRRPGALLHVAAARRLRAAAPARAGGGRARRPSRRRVLRAADRVSRRPTGAGGRRRARFPLLGTLSENLCRYLCRPAGQLALLRSLPPRGAASRPARLGLSRLRLDRLGGRRCWPASTGELDEVLLVREASDPTRYTRMIDLSFSKPAGPPGASAAVHARRAVRAARAAAALHAGSAVPAEPRLPRHVLPVPLSAVRQRLPTTSRRHVERAMGSALARRCAAPAALEPHDPARRRAPAVRRARHGRSADQRLGGAHLRAGGRGAAASRRASSCAASRARRRPHRPPPASTSSTFRVRARGWPAPATWPPRCSVPGSAIDFRRRSRASAGSCSSPRRCSSRARGAPGSDASSSTPTTSTRT